MVSESRVGIELIEYFTQRPRPHNSPYVVHLWENDLKATICGLVAEVVLSTRSAAPVSQCQDCYHILAGHAAFNPTPTEAAFLAVFFPNA